MRLFLFTVLLTTASVRACGFAGRSASLPEGHPPLGGGGGSSCGYAPTVPYMSAAANSSFVFPDLTWSNWSVPQYVAGLSTSLGIEMCYWSQQVLPNPPTVDSSTGACTWPSIGASVPDIISMFTLGSEATTRMATMDAGKWSFVSSVCGGGSVNARALCNADPTSPKCAPAVIHQRSLWAVASNVIRMTAATLPAVIANDTLWRNDWHVPAMRSAQVLNGWGNGGAISFRLLPCADVPAWLLKGPFDCDTLGPSGAHLWDVAFAFWSSYQPAQWLARELEPLRVALLGSMAGV